MAPRQKAPGFATAGRSDSMLHRRVHQASRTAGRLSCPRNLFRKPRRRSVDGGGLAALKRALQAQLTQRHHGLVYLLRRDALHSRDRKETRPRERSNARARRVRQLRHVSAARPLGRAPSEMRPGKRDRVPEIALGGIRTVAGGDTLPDLQVGAPVLRDRRPVRGASPFGSPALAMRVQ